MIARKQRMIQRIMTIVGIIIIIILSFLVILLRTDWLKSNEDIFYKYILENLNIEEVLTSEKLSEYRERNQKENYTSNGTITIDKGDKDTYLKNLKILTQENTIPETKKTSFNILGTYNDSDLFSLQYLRNEDIYGLKSNEIIDKYLTIKNDNLKEFIKKWGIQNTENLPDKIEFKNEKFEIEEEDKKDIKERYKKVIKNNISKKKFKKQKNVQVEIDGKTIKATEYGLTLSISEIRNLEKNILETAKEDQQIIDIYIKLKDDINSEKQMKEDIAERIEQINNEEIEDSENQNITIRVYVNRGKLIKTVISQNIKEYSLSIIDDKSLEIAIAQDIAKREDTYKIKITKTDQTDDILYKVEVKNEKLELSGDIQFNLKGDVNLNKIQEYYELNFNMKDEKLKIDYNIQKEFKQDIFVDDISEENSYNINDMSPEYIMSLFSDIGNLVGNLYNEKTQALGITTTETQE